MSKKKDNFSEAVNTLDQVLTASLKEVEDLLEKVELIGARIKDSVKLYTELKSKTSKLEKKIEQTQQVMYKGFDISEYYDNGDARKAMDVIDSIKLAITHSDGSKSVEEPFMFSQKKLDTLKNSTLLKKLLTVREDGATVTLELISSKGDTYICVLVRANAEEFYTRSIHYNQVGVPLTVKGMLSLLKNLADSKLKQLHTVFTKG